MSHPLTRTETEVSKPVNSSRWASQRVHNDTASRRRSGILRRFHVRNGSRNKNNASKRSSGAESTSAAISTKESRSSNETAPVDDATSKRIVYFNIPLPDSARDEHGAPKEHYARNKIRTARYTPLSFIPKDLYYQFHNVANLYFLFIVILGFFTIFGVSNPGLNATPLITILTLTAIKDAIEDWRRTTLDAEVNNSPVHRLVGYNNVNTAEDRISIWRKFKKSLSHTIQRIWLSFKQRKTPKETKRRSLAEVALDNSRPSIDTARGSISGDEIPMTRVSPFQEKPDEIKPATYHSSDRRLAETETIKESVINPHRQANSDVRFKKDFWKNVQVGDYLRVYEGEEIPADMIILSTSDVEGHAYIETKNLDGETNLKGRQALRCGRSLHHARDCEMAEFYIDSEGPQANLYSYTGAIRWKQYDPNNAHATPEDKVEPINIVNLLPRGSTVRNTDWILGVALFTGSETKIMLNSGISPSKRARISKELNWNVIYNFIILFVMCFVSGVVQGTNFGKGHNSLNYFEPDPFSTSAAINGFVTFWAALILVQNLVPISLYISLEIIRSLQAIFIYNDISMYYAPLDYPCTPKTWNISDDLGQIEYIFSDKTGTLTQNVMEFKKASINGQPYGEAYTEALAGMQKRAGVDVEKEAAQAKADIAEAKETMLRELRTLYDNPYLHDENLTFVSPDFVADLNGTSGEEQKKANEYFMLALALCHTVISEKTPGDRPSIEFKAQSPDEAALVSTARDCGFSVLGRNDDRITVNVLGQDRYFTVLSTLEFNSTRKRMSAIIRMPDGSIKLFCKGADSMIYSRLRPGQQAELRKSTAEHLEMFAREGLRTLCIADKDLTEEEFKNWHVQHQEAAAALVGRDEKLDALADVIERDLRLIGGTAIEDKLQDGVPAAIQLLGDAGIKLWVLTGDKVETAINIAFSCNLLNNDMDLIVLKSEDDNMAKMEHSLDSWLVQFGLQGSDEELEAARKDHHPPPPTHAVVIDGDALKLVLDDALRQKFLLLCKQCRAVLCCRVSPSQKAAVVEMVKTGLDCLTLAVGDGANDVAMIQEAHVGVGIAGVEGRQAVMSSDFGIGQFRFLTRLVLVHGRWSYRRLAETIANFFYKNVVWTLALWWYQIYCNFDSSYLYDYSYIVLYNLAFTSLPVILMGVFDQDVSDKVSLANPQLYKRGIERKEWTQPKFWAYMVDGLYQSVMVFWLAYFIFGFANSSATNGLIITDVTRVGVFVAGGAVLVVNIYVMFNTYRWDWLTVLINAISSLLFFFWTGIYSSFSYSDLFYKAAAEVFAQGTFWSLLFATIVICLIPRYTTKSAQQLFFPREVDTIRRQVKRGDYDYLKNYDDDELFPPNPNQAKQIGSSSSSAHPLNSHQDEEAFPGSAPGTAISSAPPQMAENRLSVEHTNGSNNKLRNSAVSSNRMSVSPRPSIDRQRSSYDRARLSMDRMRPSFEMSDHVTSAAMLTRMSSAGSGQGIGMRYNPARGRGNTIGEDDGH